MRANGDGPRQARAHTRARRRACTAALLVALVVPGLTWLLLAPPPVGPGTPPFIAEGGTAQRVSPPGSAEEATDQSGSEVSRITDDRNTAQGSAAERASQSGGLPAGPSTSEQLNDAAEKAQGLSPVAVCLVGAARDLDMSARGLQEHLLGAYGASDVFLHVPLDETAAKLISLLPALAQGGKKGGARLHTVRLFPVTFLNESAHPAGVLHAKGSPNGVQGLLQYFALVEGCLALISAAEARASEQRKAVPQPGQAAAWGPHRVEQYEWIVRARIESFWQRPPPPLATLDPAAYTIPYGSNWGGMNDRLGIGRRRISAIALRRLSVLPVLAGHKYTGLSSEKAFAAQMKVGALSMAPLAGRPAKRRATPVRVRRANFSFCMLSRRPLRIKKPVISAACDHSYMFALASPAPLNGAKCLPCRPCASAAKMEAYLARLPKFAPGWPGPFTRGVHFCRPAWPPGWQDLYKEVVGAEGVEMQQQILRDALQLRTCTRKLEMLRSSAVVWDAPSPEAVCLRAQLGKAEPLGDAPLHDFNTFVSRIEENNAVVVLGASEPSADVNGTWEHALAARVPSVRIRFMRTLPQKRTQSTIQVLKAPFLGSVKAFVGKLLGPSQAPRQVCQLLISVPGHNGNDARRHDLIAKLSAMYRFQLDSCILRKGVDVYRCTFFSLENCVLAS